MNALRVSCFWRGDLVDSSVFERPGRVALAGVEIGENRGASAVVHVPDRGPVEIVAGERVELSSGELSFVVEWVAAAPRVVGRGRRDWAFGRVVAMSFMVHGFLAVAAFLTPRTSDATVDVLRRRDVVAGAVRFVPAEPKRAPAGEKPRGAEGRFGPKALPKRDAARSKIAGVAGGDRRAQVMKLGLLGALRSGGGAMASVLGSGGLGAGINESLGGLRGGSLGDAGGAGGLATRGAGAGGGGGVLDIGGLGHGPGGLGRGPGGGDVDLSSSGKRSSVASVPSKTIVVGSLSKDEIGRVIRRNLARFKFCYERELNANPNLGGKVSVYFTIAPLGDVAEAAVRESSLESHPVEQCVLGVMRSLRFPTPRGGGIVVVTYPFVFASA